MSDDKNLNNNNSADIEDVFHESRRKRVENFKMNINPSASYNSGEANSHSAENEEGYSGHHFSKKYEYDLDNFSEKPAAGREEKSYSRHAADESSGYPGYVETNTGNSYDPEYNYGEKSHSHHEEINENADLVSDLNAARNLNNFSDDPISSEGNYSQKQKKKLEKLEKKRLKKNKKRFKRLWLLATLIMGIFVGQFLLIGFNDMLAIKRTDSATVHIEIGPDPTVDQVAQILRDNGVIDSELFFKLYTQVTNADTGFRQGSFDISKNMDYEQIVNYMQSNSNRTDVVTVQLYEGMNVLEIADKLEEEGVLTDREKFFELLNSDIYDEDYPFLENVSSEGKYYRLEGYLFPDTYDFYINEDPETTIERFLSNYEVRIVYTKYENENYDKKVTVEKMMEDSKYSMDEIMIIASIIQAEAADVEDMYYVSSVLHNRLESPIDEGLSRLDCDSTVYYPYRSKSAVPDDISDYVSNYNTYSLYGLPAGAICNPSLDAIMAALYPYDTDYFYFCHSSADSENPSQAYYATNAEEHYQNLVKAGLVDE